MNNFFVFEGPDEVGKTTVVSALEKKLRAMGKETLGFHIYQIHHNPNEYNIKTMTALSLQILHVAAHADVVERKIIPLIEKGVIVLLDRYWWSTWVYGITSNILKKNLDALIELEKSFWNNINPTILFLFSRKKNKPSNTLVSAYKDLACREKNSYPIVYLENNGTVDDAVNNILKYIL